MSDSILGESGVLPKDVILENATPILEQKTHSWDDVLALLSILICPVMYFIPEETELLKCGHRLSLDAVRGIKKTTNDAQCPTCRATLDVYDNYEVVINNNYNWSKAIEKYYDILEQLSKTHKQKCFIKHTVEKVGENDNTRVQLESMFPEFSTMSENTKLLISHLFVKKMETKDNVENTYNFIDTSNPPLRDEKWVYASDLKSNDIFTDEAKLPQVKSRIGYKLIEDFISELRRIADTKGICAILFGGYLRRKYESMYCGVNPHHSFFGDYDLDVKFKSRQDIIDIVHAFEHSGFRLTSTQSPKNYDRSVYTFKISYAYQIGDLVSKSVDMVVDDEKQSNADFNINNHICGLNAKIPELNPSEVKQFEQKSCDILAPTVSFESKRLPTVQNLFQNRLQKLLKSGWTVGNLRHHLSLTDDKELCWYFPCGHKCISQTESIGIDHDKMPIFACTCGFNHRLIND
jgi:hypothetical protein